MRRLLTAVALAVLTLGPRPCVAVAQGEPAPSPLALELAARWGVDPSAVELDWGPEGAPEGRLAGLLGSGAGGSFVAEVVRADDTTVRRRVRAGVRLLVPVAARDLERGHVLTDADIARRDTVQWGTDRPVVEPEAGWVVGRRIGAGSVLSSPAVAPPPAVRAGEAVMLVWRAGGLEVTARATAAGTAGVGERVAVRTESGRRIWGVAESRGMVRTGGGQE